MRAIVGARMPLAALAFASGLHVRRLGRGDDAADRRGRRRRSAAPPRTRSSSRACSPRASPAIGWAACCRSFAAQHAAIGAFVRGRVLRRRRCLPALRLKEFPARARGDAHLSAEPLSGAVPDCRSRCGTWRPGRSIRSTTSTSSGWDLPTARIGRCSPLAQLVQVGALLAAPLIIRRLGLLNGNRRS